MSKKRLQNNPLAHLVSEPTKKEGSEKTNRTSSEKEQDYSSVGATSDQPRGDEFKRHTFFIRKSHIRTLKRLAFEQDRPIKEILDDVLVLGLKHLTSG